jgi:hypothetical protein
MGDASGTAPIALATSRRWAHSSSLRTLRQRARAYALVGLGRMWLARGASLDLGKISPQPVIRV